jgi:pyruvate kinase
MVDNAEHLKDIRELTEGKLKIFAKIESEKAIINFDSILAQSDGIVIKINFSLTKIPKEEVYKF